MAGKTLHALLYIIGYQSNFIHKYADEVQDAIIGFNNSYHDNFKQKNKRQLPE